MAKKAKKASKLKKPAAARRRSKVAPKARKKQAPSKRRANIVDPFPGPDPFEVP